MADERWERLAEQQGVAYVKTVAEAIKLKLVGADPRALSENCQCRVLQLLDPHHLKH